MKHSLLPKPARKLQASAPSIATTLIIVTSALGSKTSRTSTRELTLHDISRTKRSPNHRLAG